MKAMNESCYSEVLHRIGLAISTLFFVTACSCPDSEYRNYTAKVYIQNTLDNSVTINLRVDYDSETDSEYRYASANIPAGEQQVVEIETRAFGNWRHGHSDCMPMLQYGNEEYQHEAEFSVDTIATYSICQTYEFRNGISRFTYSILDFETNCPENTFKIKSGWTRE
ncbi:MAG: hypothetical protein OEY38_19450 [Gammaproteobacteria bacterium]|nr:hypothetical protein [Gammaproteobacteria bacterium]